MKNFVRTLVLAALVTWPGVEYYRYQVALKQVAASADLQNRVAVKLASARSAQVAGTSDSSPKNEP